MPDLVTITRPGGSNGTDLQRKVPRHTLGHWTALGWAGPESEVQPPADEQPDGPPAPSASKAAWVDYVVAQGMSRDDADDLTKPDLVARFGA